MKLLKNQKEDIVEFDKEKHLIKSFILANRKQSKDIERDKKLIYSKSSGNSSVNSSNRSYKLKSQHSSGKSMVPIEVSWKHETFMNILCVLCLFYNLWIFKVQKMHNMFQVSFDSGMWVKERTKQVVWTFTMVLLVLFLKLDETPLNITV